MYSFFLAVSLWLNGSVGIESLWTFECSRHINLTKKMTLYIYQSGSKIFAILKAINEMPIVFIDIFSK